MVEKSWKWPHGHSGSSCCRSEILDDVNEQEESREVEGGNDQDWGRDRGQMAEGGQSVQNAREKLVCLAQWQAAVSVWCSSGHRHELSHTPELTFSVHHTEKKLVFLCFTLS